MTTVVAALWIFTEQKSEKNKQACAKYDLYFQNTV